MSQDVVLLTPEKTVLTYRLAGLNARITANLLDFLIIYGGVLVIALVASTFAAVIDPALAPNAVLLLAIAAPFLYFILFEGLNNGQTLGKMTTKIRVRMADGTPVTFGAAFVRNLLRPADMVPGFYLVGLITIATNLKNQRVGDLAAGTIVTSEQRFQQVVISAPHFAGLHPMETHIPDVRKLDLGEYYALRRLCDRYPELSAETQAGMLSEIWKPISQKLKVNAPPDVHPLYLAEATVMKFGREKGLL